MLYIGNSDNRNTDKSIDNSAGTDLVIILVIILVVGVVLVCVCGGGCFSRKSLVYVLAFSANKHATTTGYLILMFNISGSSNSIFAVYANAGV